MARTRNRSVKCGAKSSNPWATSCRPERKTSGGPEPPQSSTSSRTPGATDTKRTVCGEESDHVTGDRPAAEDGPPQADSRSARVKWVHRREVTGRSEHLVAGVTGHTGPSATH